MINFTAKPERTYALVVGIEKYQEKAWNVTAPATDALKFAHWLIHREVPKANIRLCLSYLEAHQDLFSQADLEIEAATEANIFSIITDFLSQKPGDLLYIFWAGHGLITSERERRLLCADSSKKNWQNIDLNSLLLFLNSHTFAIRHHVVIIDACANYVLESEGRPTNLGGRTFSSGRPRTESQQFILLATKEGEKAKSGYCSQAVREALEQEPPDIWPPNMLNVVNHIKQKFANLDKQQLPTYYFYQTWDGDKHSENPFTKSITPQNIPRSSVIKFVGREAALTDLHQKLQQRERVAITAIAGMGGVGKTELALQYASHYWEQGTYPGGVCWLRARDENIGEQIVNFAQNNLGLKIPEHIKGLDNQVSWCWQNWHEGNVLIVLDDVNNYGHIKSYLPSVNPHFRVLITTQLQLLQSNQRIELKVLELDTAIILLESFITKERIQNEYSIAKKICQFLGCLPLGLELVGRYLERKPYLSLAEMLERLEAKGLKQQALQKSENLTSDMRYELGVAAAFDLSWQELNSTAKELSLFLCIFDLVPISWQLIEQCFPEQDPENLEEARDEFLVYLHLLQREGKETYKLHELIREFFQSKLVELTQTNLMEAVALKIGYIATKNTICITEILQKGLLNWNFPPTSPLSALEWGKQVYIASQSWCNGLDKLAKLLMPLTVDGNLPVLGIALVEKNSISFRDDLINKLPDFDAIIFEQILIDHPNLFCLVTGWYFGNDIQENIVELPSEAIKMSDSNYTVSYLDVNALFELGWNHFKSSFIKPNVSTAWQYTFNDIIEKLSKLLQERSLPVSSGYLSLEAAWYAAIYLTRKHLINSCSSKYYEPIALDEIENCLSKVNQNQFSSMRQHCLNQLRIEIEACSDKGQTHLSFSPYVQIYKISSNISHENLLNYTAYIFQQSIESYEQLVNSLFIKLVPKLKLASILPARLVGYIVPPKNYADSISMSWHWESLSKNQKSYVDFKLIENESSLPFSFPQTALFPQRFKRTPFTRFTWLGTNPVTERVYQWLWEDLKKIGWVKGDRLNNAGFPYW
ncbi:NB-ARC domain-containing protein [Anabaena cylindrica UHCC 0172]|uniref:NB-ARC domain-containing protein n=1 Tax=Anabaena cylindrica TaxID=1165 RepID=UPI002B205093|nr:NB-ARC domain-containing protein [Anabaena cylindrica]MEA5554618.1 NB-ARC domain-containing protein [Anabaena cylindrica UHCC 0172]